MLKGRSTPSSSEGSHGGRAEEGGPLADAPYIPVDADFKDAELYEVFFPEGSVEPWHVVVGTKENDRFVYWALIQMLQSKDWEADFEWAVFMKTGRSGSSGLRHFSKKFTDGAAALRTFAEWFSEKTGNKWLGDFTSTEESFVELPGKFVLLTPEVAKSVLEHRGDKERERPKLGTTDLPVDIYFKDRSDYQVYVTPDDDLWTAVMSIQVGDRHTQYAIMQVLVAKPDIRVEFDFVVFMRHGKLGGSAQRYAKRYTVEVAALSTFHQWFKEKTGNEWLGSFKDTLESFEPVHGKYCLLSREEWSEVVEFEERDRMALIDSDIAVDYYYRDRDSYRVYHTDTGDLWAAVVAEKNEELVYKKFVLLQMLAKRQDATVDFDYVVLRRVGERGESGQWTAKKFTNELDALRTFKLWYRDETGCMWQGAYNRSFDQFVEVPGKMSLLPIDKWDDITREVTFGADSPEAMIGQAFKRSTQDPTKQSPNSSQRVSVDLLKKAMSIGRKSDSASVNVADSFDRTSVPSKDQSFEAGTKAAVQDKAVAKAVLQKAGSTASVASAAAAVKSKTLAKSSIMSSAAPINTAVNDGAPTADRRSKQTIITNRGVTDDGAVSPSTTEDLSTKPSTAKQVHTIRATTKTPTESGAAPEAVQPATTATTSDKRQSAAPPANVQIAADPTKVVVNGKAPRRSKKSSAPAAAAVVDPSTVAGDTPATSTAEQTSGGKPQPAVAGGTKRTPKVKPSRQDSASKVIERSTGRAPSTEEPDHLFPHRDRYKNVVSSVKLTQTDAAGKVRFYVMQLLEDIQAEVGSKEKYCFYVRTGKAASEGATNFKTHASLDAGKRSFAKKFQEKTKNEWLGDVSSTLPKFAGVAGEFHLVSA